MQDLDPRLDFRKIIKEHDQREIEESIERFDSNIDEVYDYLVNGSQLSGDKFGWSKTWDKFSFADSCVTCWSGVNGNGKSGVMAQTALAFAQSGSKTVICSMEMPTKTTKAKMIRQATGMHSPAKPFVEATIKKLNDKIFLFNRVGKVDAQTLKGVIVYAAETLKAKHVMIDSLVKVANLGTDDFTGQRDFVSDLTDLAKEYKIHIHLVVHMRKGQHETDVGDKFSIKGAGEIVDLVDNAILVSRNTKKEQIMRSGSDEQKDQWRDRPDGFLRIAKNRHGEWEGQFNFWWHADSQSWVESPGRVDPIMRGWSRYAE